jgi:hypothetical protein
MVRQVVAMRDVDVNFRTHFITHAGSNITTVHDLKGKIGRAEHNRNAPGG